MRTVRDAIDRHAEAQPDAPFLLAPEPGTTLTYAGLRMTAQALCAEAKPEWRELRPDHFVACHFAT